MVTAAKVAFARVSSQDQILDQQLEAYKSINPDRIFTDKLFGKNIDRPGFKDMMDYVRGGDHLYVASMDRLACNLKENISLDPTGDQSPIAKLLLSMMGAVAEFERSLIRERQAEGIAIAKTRGAYKGLAPIRPELISQVKEKIAMGVPISHVAKNLKIGRTTIYKYLKEAQTPEQRAQLRPERKQRT